MIQNFVQVLWVDNVKEVSAFYKNGNKGGSFGGFDRQGHDLLVLADPFHVLQSVGKTLVKNHPLSPKFSGDHNVDINV